MISSRHIITAAHCVKNAGRDLRARLGEWDVNNDIEFYPYIERDIVNVFVHPEFYAGTLTNDIAILKLDHDIDFAKNPHISAACLPDKHDDFTNSRCVPHNLQNGQIVANKYYLKNFSLISREVLLNSTFIESYNFSRFDRKIIYLNIATKKLYRRTLKL